MKVKTVKVEGWKLKIYYDEYASNPREDRDNAFTFAFRIHRDYSLGDEKGREDLFDELWAAQDKMTIKDWSFLEDTEGEYRLDVMAYLFHKYKLGLILPLHFSNHGAQTSVTMSRHYSGLDDEPSGYAFITRKTLLYEWGNKRVSKSVLDRATRYLEGEVAEYSAYVNGDVFGYKLYEKAEYGWRAADSQWGFYGWDFQRNGMADEIASHSKELAQVLQYA
jgi:hypothetical protein